MTDEELEEVYYYETFQGSSSKFWEITIKYRESTYIIRSGRVGTEGTKIKKVWYSFEAARYQATLLRKAKEKEGYILLKTKELGNKPIVNFRDIFDAFLRANRPELICPYEPYGLNPTYGRFPDDVYDQNLWDFFRDIAEKIYFDNIDLSDSSKTRDLRSEMKNLTINFNPNERVDESIKYGFAKSPFHQDKDITFQTLPYPKDFQSRIEKWVIINLNDLFLNKFYIHQERFTSGSINKIVEATTKFILDQTYYFALKDKGSIEKDIEYLDSVVLWYDKVNLALLFSIIDDLYNLFPYGKTYKDIMYWIKPRIYYPYKNLKELEILNTILENEKSDQIPIDLCSKELLIKIRSFTDEILSNVLNNSKPLRDKLFDVGYRLFLHFAYFGFLDGEVSGIEQGTYSFDQLEKELDEFYQYKSIYFKNKSNSI